MEWRCCIVLSVNKAQRMRAEREEENQNAGISIYGIQIRGSTLNAQHFHTDTCPGLNDLLDYISHIGLMFGHVFALISL